MVHAFHLFCHFTHILSLEHLRPLIHRKRLLYNHFLLVSMSDLAGLLVLVFTVQQLSLFLQDLQSLSLPQLLNPRIHPRILTMLDFPVSRRRGHQSLHLLADLRMRSVLLGSTPYTFV